MRTYAFGDIPPGLNQDEASIGYDAYATLHYGVDRNGFHFPVHFKTWGAGQNALHGYLSMPFILLFGLSSFSVRFVDMVFGVLALFIFYLFVKEISGKNTALVATFLLAISPWHIMLSRWGLETNVFPPIFLLGNFFLIRSLKKNGYLPFSFFLFAICLYTNCTAFFIVPLFILAASSYLIYHKKIKLKWMLLSFLVLLIFSLPAFLFIIVNNYQLGSIETPFLSIPQLTAPRWKTTSTIFSDQILEKYPFHFMVFTNFIINQNDGHISMDIPPYGFIYPLSLPFALLGLIILFKDWNLRMFNKCAFVIFWFLLSIVLAGLIFAIGYRINIIFFPLIFFTAVGIIYIKKMDRSIFFLIIAGYLILFAMFAHEYFTSYPDMVGPPFFESLGDAINHASNITSGKICVTGQVNMPYVYVLFYRQFDPDKFISTVKYSNPGAEFRGVSSFDRYYFGLDYCESVTDISAYVFHNSEANKFINGNFAITRFKYYSVALKLKNTK